MLDNKTINGKIKLTILMIVYYTLIVNYGHFIDAKFERVTGHEKIAFNLVYYLINLITVIGYALMFPIKMKYVSDYLVLFILLFINLPIGYFCLLKLDNYLLSFFFIFLNYLWFFIWSLGRNLFFTTEQIKFKFNIKNIVVFFVVVSALYFLFKNGVGFSFYEKSEIYKVRKLFKSKETGIILRYLLLLMQYSLIPIILLIAIRLKNKVFKVLLIIIAIMCAFSIFTATALKSSLFVLVFVLIAYSISVFKINTTSKFLIILNIGFITLTLFKDYNLYFIEIYDHIIRRVFYFPTKTGVLAYDYFLFHCNDCGLFSGIGDNIGQTLSLFYFGTEGNATTGFLANSLLNRGIIKTCVNILFFLITLKLIDSVTKNAPIKYGLVVFIVFGYVLSNTALSTILISYGLVLSIIIFIFLKKWLINKK